MAVERICGHCSGAGARGRAMGTTHCPLRTQIRMGFILRRSQADRRYRRARQMAKERAARALPSRKEALPDRLGGRPGSDSPLRGRVKPAGASAANQGDPGRRTKLVADEISRARFAERHAHPVRARPSPDAAHSPNARRRNRIRALASHTHAAWARPQRRGTAIIPQRFKPPRKVGLEPARQGPTLGAAHQRSGVRSGSRVEMTARS